MGRPGKREFVRVLRLLETFPADEVHAAVQDAISRGATGYVVQASAAVQDRGTAAKTRS